VYIDCRDQICYNMLENKSQINLISVIYIYKHLKNINKNLCKFHYSMRPLALPLS